MAETLDELKRRLHSGHIGYDELVLWYHALSTSYLNLAAEIKASLNEQGVKGREPVVKRELAITEIRRAESFIYFNYASPDALADTGRWGRVFDLGDGVTARLTVSGCYDFDDVVAYLQNYTFSS